MALLQNGEETHLSRWLVCFLSARFKDCLEILLESKSTFVAMQGWAFHANSGRFYWCYSYVHLISHLPWQWQVSVTHSCHQKSDKLVSEAFGKVIKSFLYSVSKDITENVFKKWSSNTFQTLCTVEDFEVINNL